MSLVIQSLTFLPSNRHCPYIASVGLYPKGSSVRYSTYMPSLYTDFLRVETKLIPKNIRITQSNVRITTHESSVERNIDKVRNIREVTEGKVLFLRQNVCVFFCLRDIIQYTCRSLSSAICVTFLNRKNAGYFFFPAVWTRYN
jgi:hypothetical protein